MTAVELRVGGSAGPYRIDELIGAGGMGQVFRGFDTRLHRAVAIKTSRTEFDDRFVLEARTIATLNHPNVCTLYDVGPSYLVMELVEGETLTERLVRGPLAVAETTRLARQIADALEAAHENGIVHRDLKPGNIMIRTDGTVKVLDFGLAKAISPPATGAGESSATITVEDTLPGVVLGTAPYMSPERALGEPADRRSDIYSFGLVVYEMLTGKRLHHGDTRTEILASVIKDEPRWDVIPDEFQKALRRCLAKDRHERLRHIGDVMALVDTSAPRAANAVWSRRWLWPAALVAAIIAAAILVGRDDRDARPIRSPSRFAVPIPGGLAPTVDFAVSPDGQNLAISAEREGRRNLYVRPMNGLDARVVPGTEGASALFWSPDGTTVAFVADGKLRTATLDGHLTTLVASPTRAFYGGSWGSSGILFADRGTLWHLPDARGLPAEVRPAGKFGSVPSSPEWLPGERSFVFTAESTTTGNDRGIYVGFLDGRAPVRLLGDRSKASFVPAGPAEPTGFLLFRRNGKLMAQPFDPRTPSLSGTAVALAEDDVISKDGYGPIALVSASDTGMLAYQAKTIEQLVWLDRAGKPVEYVGPPGEYQNFRLSWDSTRVTMRIDRFDSFPSSADVAVLDLKRGFLERLTTDGDADLVPVFSRDGKKVAFTSKRVGDFNPYVTTGPNAERLLADMPGSTGWPLDWSPDDASVLWQADGLWEVSANGEKEPRRLVDGKYRPRGGQYSPDGRWLAYSSLESGREELYVRRLPSGPRFTASANGGKDAAWRRDGKALFYVDGNGVLTSVTVTLTTTTPIFGQEEKLFPAPVGGFRRNYEVSPDGQRFLVAVPAAAGGAAMTVILNWPSLLQKR